VSTTDPDFDTNWLPEDHLSEEHENKAIRGVRLRINLPEDYPTKPPKVTVLSKHPIQTYLQDEIDAYLVSQTGHYVLRALAKWVDRKIGVWRPPQDSDDEKNKAKNKAAEIDPENAWTLAQQLMLEDALMEFPKSMEKHARWRAIASRVEGKSKRQVIERFASLRKALREAQSAARAEFEKQEAELVAQRESEVEAIEWSDEQQAALDAALAEFPATMDKNERWKSIAKAVPGKSKRECVERFKELRQKLLDQKAQQPATQTEEHAKPADMPAESEGPEALPDLHPDEVGTKLTVTSLHMSNVDVLFLTSLKCVISCSACGKDSITRIGDKQAVKIWCEGCSARLVVRLNPALVHGGDSPKCAFFDTEHAIVQDVASCDLRASCSNCSKLATFTDLQRVRPQEQACRACHTKLRLEYQNWELEIIEKQGAGASASGSKRAKNIIKISQAAQEQARQITPGKPLPNLGICRHYSKSFRWLRFPCCGLAYPCDICHEVEGQCAETKWATRHICGFCGTEQPITKDKPCTNCGKYINITKASSHWEGGKGQRNQKLMSGKDSRKYKNSKLKTKSNKSNRVGPKPKP